MSFPSKENFDISFIERTKYNIDKYEDKYDFTMLINSLLGLLIIPNECIISDKRSFKYDFLNKKLNQIAEIKEIFRNSKFTYTEDKKEIEIEKFLFLSKNGSTRNIEDVTFGQLIRRLRNGIAHFGFTPLKTQEQWSRIIINNHKDKILNFEIYLTKQEIIIITDFLVKQYTKHLKK